MAERTRQLQREWERCETKDRETQDGGERKAKELEMSMRKLSERELPAGYDKTQRVTHGS